MPRSKISSPRFSNKSTVLNKPPYKGPERRFPVLSEEEMDALAERVVEKTIEKVTERMYLEIGRTVINKLLIAIGTGIVAFYFYARHHGWIH